MRRGLLLGATAALGVVGALNYEVGTLAPAFLVGESPAAAFAATAASGQQTVDGDAIATRFGNVQVQLVLNGSDISNINVLQYPTGRNQQWSSYSIPKLVSAALTAQSAEISTISGATYTSMGFISSLESALARK